MHSNSAKSRSTSSNHGRWNPNPGMCNRSLMSKPLQEPPHYTRLWNAYHWPALSPTITNLHKRLTTAPYTTLKSRSQNDSHSRKPKLSVIMTTHSPIKNHIDISKAKQRRTNPPLSLASPVFRLLPLISTAKRNSCSLRVTHLHRWKLPKPHESAMPNIRQAVDEYLYRSKKHKTGHAKSWE